MYEAVDDGMGGGVHDGVLDGTLEGVHDGATIGMVNAAVVAAPAADVVGVLGIDGVPDCVFIGLSVLSVVKDGVCDNVGTTENGAVRAAVLGLVLLRDGVGDGVRDGPSDVVIVAVVDAFNVENVVGDAVPVGVGEHESVQQRVIEGVLEGAGDDAQVRVDDGVGVGVDGAVLRVVCDDVHDGPRVEVVDAVAVEALVGNGVNVLGVGVGVLNGVPVGLTVFSTVRDGVCDNVGAAEAVCDMVLMRDAVLDALQLRAGVHEKVNDEG